MLVLIKYMKFSLADIVAMQQEVEDAYMNSEDVPVS